MNIKSLDLNLLKVLDALLATASTVDAGQRIGLSQPAVSAALGRLRVALDDQLFIRQGRHLVPTEYASGLRDPLRALLEQTESILSAGKQFEPVAYSGTFKLSGSDFFAELLMPRLAERLGQVAPGMRIQLVDLVPENYINTLYRYSVDIALIPEAPLPAWIEQRRLFTSGFSVIARSRHPRTVQAGILPGDVIPIDLFCDLNHVLFSPEGQLSAMGDAALEKIGRRRRVAMTMPVFSGVCTAVAQSDLIALVPHQLAVALSNRIGLDIFVPPMPVLPAHIVMIWHRRATDAPAHRWLRGQIADLMNGLDDPAFNSVSNTTASA